MASVVKQRPFFVSGRYGCLKITQPDFFPETRLCISYASIASQTNIFSMYFLGQR